MQAAIFLDRDGVIIENRPNYVRSWNDVLFYQHSLSALAKISKSHFKIVIVTNQSAVGRGILPLSAARKINQRLVDVIEEAGGRIDGVFMCPHAPEDGCDCRKPEPGLLLRAAQNLSLDLGRSIIIGDAVSDLLAGQNAGVLTRILLKSGRGQEQYKLSHSMQLDPFLVYETLADALRDLHSF
jgi:D-glycero-D-manno-heptose 1,7-bisphosphate phosphatase